jgi:hypothetical protein
MLPRSVLSLFRGTAGPQQNSGIKLSQVLKHHFRLSAFSDKDEGHSDLAGERK